jgi:hypothetical protein
MNHENAEDAKFCNGCKADKPPSDFAKNRCAKDGRQSRCRTCQSGAVRNSPSQRAQRVRGQERRRKRDELRAAGMKKCSKCQLPKPFDGFCSNRSTPDGRSAVCRDCASAARGGGVVYRVVPRTSPIAANASTAAALQQIGDTVGGVMMVCARTFSRSRCACGSRRVSTCGFPAGDSTCDEVLCGQCRHPVREGLDYCERHHERSQAALADLARRKGA